MGRAKSAAALETKFTTRRMQGGKLPLRPLLAKLVGEGWLSRDRLLAIFCEERTRTRSSGAARYRTLNAWMEATYGDYLRQYFSALGYSLDPVILKRTLDRLRRAAECHCAGVPFVIRFLAHEKYSLSVLRARNRCVHIPVTDLVWEKIIENRIGGLNGRSTFVRYLLGRVHALLHALAPAAEIISHLDHQTRFWSAVLADQLRRYDEQRDEGKQIPRSYLLINNEFDDLFRWCDPADKFGLDIRRIPSGLEIQGWVDEKFKPFLLERRARLPRIEYPVTLRQFYACLPKMLWELIWDRSWRWFHFLWKKRLLKKKKCTWDRIFCKTPGETPEIRRNKKIWLAFVAVWAAYLVSVIYLSGLMCMGAGTAERWWAIIITLPLIGLLIPLTFFQILYFLRAGLAWVDGKKNGPRIQTWGKLKKYWRGRRNAWKTSQVGQYRVLIEDLFREYKLTESEKKGLFEERMAKPPRNQEAQERIRNWVARQDHPGIPAVSCWAEAETVTLQISSVDEKFYYHWDELTENKDEHGTEIESILHRVRKVYADEWDNLLHELLAENQIDLSEEIYLSLEKFTPRLNPIHHRRAVRQIEAWANLRLQTLFNSLEGARKAFSIYTDLAREFFPGAGDNELQEMVNEKVQLVLIHDRYALYPHDHRQRIDIDRYCTRHPQVELAGFTDHLHKSKYGAWARALSLVRGEMLMTFDADHQIRREEMRGLPATLLEFARNPRLGAVQYGIYVFNEKYSTATQCTAVGENVWATIEQRVKHLIGGVGVYGKVILRTEFLKYHEGLQDDAVAEDVMTSLRYFDQGIQTMHVEHLQIGQGQDVSQSAASIPLKRYPAGAIESGLSKTSLEFLFSKRAPWNIKIDTVFTAGYYYKKPLVIAGVLLAVLGYATQIMNGISTLLAVFWGFLWTLAAAESINASNLIYCSERFGWWKGTWKFIASLPKISCFYLPFIPCYAEQVKKALNGFSKFIVTPKVSYIVREPWAQIYRRFRLSIWLGTWILILFSMTPLRWVTFLAYSLTIFSGLMWLWGPFLLNPSGNEWKRRLSDIILGPMWAMAVAVYETTWRNLEVFYLHRKVRKLGRACNHVPEMDQWVTAFKNLLQIVVGRRDFLSLKKWVGHTFQALNKVGSGDDLATVLRKYVHIGEQLMKGDLDFQEWLEICRATEDGERKATRVSKARNISLYLVNLAAPEHPVISWPLGLEVLAGDLKRHFGSKCRVTIWDMQFSTQSTPLVKKILKERPEIIGLSLQIGTLEMAKEILDRLFARISSNAYHPVVILGNVVATFAPDELLKLYPNVLIAIGEGEWTLREVVKQKLRGVLNPAEIPNLAYASEGSVHFTPRKLVDLFDHSLPTTITLPKVVRTGGTVWVEASRGCNGTCTFCSRRPIRDGHGWAPFPVSKVVNEVTLLAKHFGVRHFRFSDDNFLGPSNRENHDRARELALKLKPLHITFDCSARADAVYKQNESPEENAYRRETFERLRDAGLVQVFVGIESGSASQLRRYGKGVSVQENIETIEIYKQLGIQVVVAFIMFDPLMNIEEAGENIRFIEKLDLVSKSENTFVNNVMNCLRAQAGSPYLNLLAARGLLGRRENGLVSFGAQYKEEKIGRMVAVIQRWTGETFPLIYALKSAVSIFSMSRKEFQGEEYLYRFKMLDLDFLKALLEEKTDGGFHGVLEIYRKKRTDLISEIYSRSQAGGLDDIQHLFGREINKLRASKMADETLLDMNDGSA